MEFAFQLLQTLVVQLVLQTDGVVLQLHNLRLQLMSQLGVVWLGALPAEIAFVIDVLKLTCEGLGDLSEAVCLG